MTVVRRARDVVLLLFRPQTFAKHARGEVSSLQSPVRSLEDQFTQNTAAVRNGLFVSACAVTGAGLAAYIAGRVLAGTVGLSSTGTNRGLQVGGIGILLWATLAKQGWNIQTLHGFTMPERVDGDLYRALYVLGSFLLGLSLFWPSVL